MDSEIHKGTDRRVDSDILKWRFAWTNRRMKAQKKIKNADKRGVRREKKIKMEY